MQQSIVGRLLFQGWKWVLDFYSFHPELWIVNNLVSETSDYPSAQRRKRPFLLPPFGKLINFLLKCPNNYSDMQVNCLISIAMEAIKMN